MIRTTIGLTLLALTLASLGCANGPEISMDGEVVSLSTRDLDVRLTKAGSHDGAYMLFGGTHVDQHNAIGSVLLAGLHTSKAASIYRRHPDFHRCNSAGAPLAKKAIIDLQIIPADDTILGTLTDALDEFEESIRQGGDRVCVALDGTRLMLESIVVREADEEIGERYPIKKFYLVDSARLIDCRDAMEG